jgi:hypothetical protein
VRVALWLAGLVLRTAAVLLSFRAASIYLVGQGARYLSPPPAWPRVALRALSKSIACDSGRGPSLSGGRAASSTRLLIGSCGIGVASDGRHTRNALPCLHSLAAGSVEMPCFLGTCLNVLHLFVGYVFLLTGEKELCVAQYPY